MPHVMTLDQGTTSSRALIVDERGEVVSIGQFHLKNHFPKPGWVQQDGEEIWAMEQKAMETALSKARLTFSDLSAIGITNQRETTLVWERKTGKVIAPAIVWQDRRTSQMCHEIHESQEMIREKTGLILDPYFSATKLRWILDHHQGEDLLFGTVDCFLLWKMTGNHVTDTTNASRTMLYNIYDGCWDKELLQLFDIQEDMLPTVLPSKAEFGHYQGVPVCGVAGDQQSSLFGHGCHSEGEGKITYGTGCFSLIHSGNTPKTSPNLLTTLACQTGDTPQYALEGSVFMGGALIEWLKREMHFIKEAFDMDTLASTVDSSEGVIFVPAFTGLGAPYWKPEAKGTLFGLTRGTEQGHIARAALEGIVLQVTDLMDDFPNGLHIDGGVAKSDIAMQLQADYMQRALYRAAQTEITGLGAAYLAGLHVGIWEDTKDLWKEDKTFSPSISSVEAEKKQKEWRRAVECVITMTSSL